MEEEDAALVWAQSDPRQPELSLPCCTAIREISDVSFDELAALGFRSQPDYVFAGVVDMWLSDRK